MPSLPPAQVLRSTVLSLYHYHTSTPLLGRCVPTFGLVAAGRAGGEVANISRMKVSDTESLDSGNLQTGIRYLMEALDLRSYGSRFLADLAQSW